MSVSAFFLPNRQIIQSITKANPGVVTTTQDHGYDDGLFVRLVLAQNFGMQQVNNQVYQITVLSSNSFSIGADTSNFDSFVDSSSSQDPQVIPVGEVADTLEMAVRNSGNITPEI